MPFLFLHLPSPSHPQQMGHPPPCPSSTEDQIKTKLKTVSSPSGDYASASSTSSMPLLFLHLPSPSHPQQMGHPPLCLSSTEDQIKTEPKTVSSQNPYWDLQALNDLPVPLLLHHQQIIEMRGVTTLVIYSIIERTIQFVFP
jgi:hypothetical protein